MKKKNEKKKDQMVKFIHKSVTMSGPRCVKNTYCNAATSQYISSIAGFRITRP